jgi:hypothetical protein
MTIQALRPPALLKTSREERLQKQIAFLRNFFPPGGSAVTSYAQCFDGGILSSHFLVRRPLRYWPKAIATTSLREEKIFQKWIRF